MNGIQMRSKNVNFPSSAAAASASSACSACSTWAWAWAPSLCEKAVPRALRWELKSRRLKMCLNNLGSVHYLSEPPSWKIGGCLRKIWPEKWGGSLEKFFYKSQAIKCVLFASIHYIMMFYFHFLSKGGLWKFWCEKRVFENVRRPPPIYQGGSLK